MEVDGIVCVLWCLVRDGVTCDVMFFVYLFRCDSARFSWSCSGSVYHRQ